MKALFKGKISAMRKNDDDHIILDVEVGEGTVTPSGAGASHVGPEARKAILSVRMSVREVIAEGLCYGAPLYITVTTEDEMED
jgi:hypothetical protein